MILKTIFSYHHLTLFDILRNREIEKYKIDVKTRAEHRPLVPRGLGPSEGVIRNVIAVFEALLAVSFFLNRQII